MNEKNKWIVNLAKGLLIYGLLAYASSRTLHFVTATMPAESQLWGYLFLLSTGIGAVIWQQIYLHKASGSKQRGLSFVMAILDLLAEMVMVYADTQTVSATNGLVVMTKEDVSLFIFASVAIISVNIIAGFMFDLFDPDAEAEQHTKDATDQITNTILKDMSTPATQALMVQTYGPALRDAFAEGVAHSVASAAAKYGARSLENRPVYQPGNRVINQLPMDPTAPPAEKPESWLDMLSEAARVPFRVVGIVPKDEKKLQAVSTKAQLYCLGCGKPTGDKLYCNPTCEDAYTQRIEKIENARKAKLEENPSGDNFPVSDSECSPDIDLRTSNDGWQA